MRVAESLFVQTGKKTKQTLLNICPKLSESFNINFLFTVPLNCTSHENDTTEPRTVVSYLPSFRKAKENNGINGLKHEKPDNYRLTIREGCTGQCMSGQGMLVCEPEEGMMGLEGGRRFDDFKDDL